MRATIRIQMEDFDIGHESDALTAGSNAGALVNFVGLVRDDHALISLTLEHYPGMTEREIGRHVDEAASRWPLTSVTVIHRVGRLVPGDKIVFVGATSSHRQAAFEATEFLMDYLKTRAPFWKSEERADGMSWAEARASDESAAERWTEKS